MAFHRLHKGVPSIQPERHLLRHWLLCGIFGNVVGCLWDAVVVQDGLCPHERHTHVGTCSVYLGTSALGFQRAGTKAPVQNDVLMLCVSKTCGHVCGLQEQSLEWLHHMV